MKNKEKNLKDDYWNRKANLRVSHQNFLDRPKNVFKEFDENETLNDKLMKYSEFKAFYKRTNIKPIYLVYVLVVFLVLIVIGFFEDLLTCLIAISYPIYISMKTLRSKTKEEVKQWLTYWVCFSVFLNVESIFGFLLKNLPLYFFGKVIFLLICYLPQYNGARWIYENIIKDIFHKYEKIVYDYSVKITNKLAVVIEETKEVVEDIGEKAAHEIVRRKFIRKNT